MVLWTGPENPLMCPSPSSQRLRFPRLSFMSRSGCGFALGVKSCNLCANQRGWRKKSCLINFSIENQKDGHFTGK